MPPRRSRAINGLAMTRARCSTRRCPLSDRPVRILAPARRAAAYRRLGHEVAGAGGFTAKLRRTHCVSSGASPGPEDALIFHSGSRTLGAGPRGACACRIHPPRQICVPGPSRAGRVKAERWCLATTHRSTSRRCACSRASAPHCSSPGASCQRRCRTGSPCARVRSAVLPITSVPGKTSLACWTASTTATDRPHAGCKPVAGERPLGRVGHENGRPHGRPFVVRRTRPEGDRSADGPTSGRRPCAVPRPCR